MVNVDNFHRTMAIVTRDTLNMESWALAHGTEAPEPLASCGTTMCLAGHAVSAAGIGLQWEPYEWEERMNEHGEWEDVVTSWHAEYTEDGDLIEVKGAELLGLDESDAEYLFHLDITNDLDRLWSEIESTTDGLVKRPA